MGKGCRGDHYYYVVNDGPENILEMIKSSCAGGMD